MTPPCTSLVHDQFRSAVQQRIDHGTTDEVALATVLLGVYDRSCEIPSVAHYIDEWAKGVLNEDR